jgi:hypothetical protein
MDARGPESVGTRDELGRSLGEPESDMMNLFTEDQVTVLGRIEGLMRMKMERSRMGIEWADVLGEILWCLGDGEFAVTRIRDMI